jgi:hypothetical protein
MRRNYCHEKEPLETGFGLEIGFIDHLQVVTASNYNTILNFNTLKSLQHTVSLFSLLCLRQSFPGNGF